MRGEARRRFTSLSSRGRGLDDDRTTREHALPVAAEQVELPGLGVVQGDDRTPKLIRNRPFALNQGTFLSAESGGRVYPRLTDIESTPLGVTMEVPPKHGSHQGAALMKRSTKYVGLDVHQATTVAAVREGSGRVIARSVIPTEADALLEFFRGMRGSVHVTFEEGTQAQWLHDLLVPVVGHVLVCDRRGESKRGNKGDQLDCDELSELLRRGALRAVYHGSAHRAALKELVRTYLNLVEDSTRTMQRIKALFRARAIRVRGPGVYGSRERSDWLAKLPDPAVRFRAKTLYAQLDLLKSLRQEAKAAMIAEGRKDPAWRVLLTIPHVGPVRAALILATMQTPWRFRTKRQLWAYAGLAVVTRSSSRQLDPPILTTLVHPPLTS
jgi:transposase